jgi:hypothetical protein
MLDRDTTAIETRLDALSPAAVSGLVCQVLGAQGWAVPNLRHARIHLSTGQATGGIYRLTGTAKRGSQQRDWSIILKVVVPLAGITPQENEIQSHPIYWKREALAYQSGWLDHLPGGIRGPRCLAAEEQPDGTIWLWLEDVHDRYGVQWPLAQYATAARCLGRFNGAYLAGQDWPPYAWLNRTGSEPRGVIEHYLWIEKLVYDPATWDHPLLRATFAPSLVARLPQFWSNRHALLEALERMPRTLCHQDAWRGNMMAADNELVVIDWSYAGRSVIGTDLGDLAVAGYGLIETEISLAAIDEAVFESYLDGLREAGFPAERSQVRFAYTTYAALKYGCLLIWLHAVPNEQRHEFWERISGQRMDRYLRQQAIMLEHLLRLLDEARTLLEVV